VLSSTGLPFDRPAPELREAGAQSEALGLASSGFYYSTDQILSSNHDFRPEVEHKPALENVCGVCKLGRSGCFFAEFAHTRAVGLNLPIPQPHPHPHKYNVTIPYLTNSILERYPSCS
jgi:hypothetical protein